MIWHCIKIAFLISAAPAAKRKCAGTSVRLRRGQWGHLKAVWISKKFYPKYWERCSSSSSSCCVVTFGKYSVKIKPSPYLQAHMHVVFYILHQLLINKTRHKEDISKQSAVSYILYFQYIPYFITSTPAVHKPKTVLYSHTNKTGMVWFSSDWRSEDEIHIRSAGNSCLLVVALAQKAVIVLMGGGPCWAVISLLQVAGPSSFVSDAG